MAYEIAADGVVFDSTFKLIMAALLSKSQFCRLRDCY